MQGKQIGAIIKMTLSIVKFIPQTFSGLVISLENIEDQMSYSKFTGALIFELPTLLGRRYDGLCDPCSKEENIDPVANDLMKSANTLRKARKCVKVIRKVYLEL